LNEGVKWHDGQPFSSADVKYTIDEVILPLHTRAGTYKSVIDRFEETYAAYPEFSQMDEFLYIAGMSSWYLSEGKGKQKPPTATPEKKEEFSPENMRATARDYLTRLVNDYPKSDFHKEAQEALASLGEAKPAEAKQQ